MTGRMGVVRGRRAGVGAIAALAVSFAACGGGGDDTTDEGGTTAPAATEEAGEEPSEDTASEDTASEDTSAEVTSPPTTEAAADFEPGATGMRVVNLLDRPVDVYVRSTGFVVAYPMQAGLVPGEVTEFFFPPEQGSLAVLDAGATGADCVADCPQIIAQLTAFEENGPASTVVLYDDAGTPRALDLWEQAGPDRAGNANAMVPADPAAGVAVVTAIAVDDADFGLRLSMEGTEGCVEPFNLENVLIGGNQTPAFALSADPTVISLHDNQDRDCVEAPVGGPFEVPGAAGTRVHVLLSGTPGALEAIVLPMTEPGQPIVGGAAAGGSGDTGDAAGADDDRRELAVELMAAEAEVELGLDPDQALCAAGFIVDALGVDLLLDGDQLVDLDSLPAETADIAGEAVGANLEECGIDPAQLGG